jgi:hypothetical protein
MANFQYALADTIGVQTQSNLGYFDRWKFFFGKRLEDGKEKKNIYDVSKKKRFKTQKKEL